MAKKRMLINAIDREEKRMAIIDNSKLTEFNIQMSVREPITGNIYKGIAMKIERGLHAAFVDYGGKRNGFLPLHDVSPEYLQKKEGEEENNRRPQLKVGQEVLVQVLREEKDRKGAMLTTFISLPGRYLVLMPNRQSTGVSRKIEDEGDRKRLKETIEHLNKDERMGLIVRTAGLNRKKQELSRDYQHLIRLWNNIEKKAESATAPALIYRESDFGVKSLRDYFTSDIEEILIDDVDTFKIMRDYWKTVQPRNVNMIKLYKEKVPLFDKFSLEGQINEVYRERVNLKSGAYLVINATEAMITIDVNSGRASNKRDVEETAFKTNIEAAEEIARQLRLRDLGGLIVIDFIDMRDKRHVAELEKAFKRALSLDRSRIQLSKISRFGIIELSRQKKQSTIQEISYEACPHCKGTGLQPSLEYTALGAFRKIKSEVVKENYSTIRVRLPSRISDYLLNNKRSELTSLEQAHDTDIYISGDNEMRWGESHFEFVKKESVVEADEAKPAAAAAASASESERVKEAEAAKKTEEKKAADEAEKPKKKHHRRPRRRRRKPKSPDIGSQDPVAPESPPGAAAGAEEIQLISHETADALLPVYVETEIEE